jgi:hypothetical protein
VADLVGGNPGKASNGFEKIMQITKTSQFSGKTNTMDIPITLEQYASFQRDNRPIQKIFPFLSANEREFLLTGSTQEEWDKMFGEDEK